MPHELMKNSLNEKFLVCDSGVIDENRMLISQADRQQETKEKAETWNVDGFFKYILVQFHQIETFNSIISGKAIQLSFILSKNRNGETYERAFKNYYRN